MPYHAMPDLTSPHVDTPRVAATNRVYPQGIKNLALPMTSLTLRRPTLHFHAMPCAYKVSPISPVMPDRAWPHLALPRQTYPQLDQPGVARTNLTGPCYSQTSSRQLTGSKSLCNNLPVSPRCPLSARSAWQMGHKVRRLLNLLSSGLRRLMWSIWQSSSDIDGLPTQIGGCSGDWHTPLSRRHTSNRRTRHNSRGIRLGIADLKGLYNETPVADGSTITKPAEFTRVVYNAFHLSAANDSFVPQQSESEMPTRSGSNAIAHVAAFGCWIFNAADVQINRLVHICRQRFLWHKPINQDDAVSDLQRGGHRALQRTTLAGRVSSALTQAAEHISPFNEQLPFGSHEDGTPPFFRVVARYARLFLFLDGHTIRPECVPQHRANALNCDLCCENVTQVDTPLLKIALPHLAHPRLTTPDQSGPRRNWTNPNPTYRVVLSHINIVSQNVLFGNTREVSNNGR